MASDSLGNATCISKEDFLSLHRPQLLSIGLPEHLWDGVYRKLTPIANCDTGEVFELRKDVQFESPGRWSLHAKQALQKFSDVFLVQHIWSNDGGSTAKRNLEKSPELLARMKEIMERPENSVGEKHASSEGDLLDSSLVVSQITGVDKKKAVETLQSTGGDLIEALCQITDSSYETEKPSKSDRSKIMTLEEFKKGFLHGVGMEKAKLLSEEYVQKMYLRYKREKEQYPESTSFGKGTTPNYSWFEEDEGAMAVFVSVPMSTKKRDVVSKLSTKRWTLGLKGCPPIIDGEFYGNVCPDESFWTFDSPGLLIMTLQKPENEESELWPVLMKGEKHLTEKEISDQAKEKSEKVDYDMHKVLENMWHYNQTYQVVTSEGNKQKPVWYIMDEFGSAIGHSVHPNVKCSPFAFAVTGEFYSILWPIENINVGEMCCRNFCPALSLSETHLQREARLLAFNPSSFPESCLKSFVVELAQFPALPKENCVTITAKSVITKTGNINCTNSRAKKLNLKFFLEKTATEKKLVLRDLGCTEVGSSSEADAVWFEKWSIPAERIPKNTRVNRLGGEENLLQRHLLASHIQKTWGKVPWFPVTYNMSTDLAALCADHCCRGLSSYWILRAADPSKLSFRPVVTSDLRRALRSSEIGQLVASYYCFQTAWCRKRHFRLQYAVTVKSLRPLKLLVHNTPHVNLAEKEIDPNAFLDEYIPSALVASSSGVKQNGVMNHRLTYQEFVADLRANFLAIRQASWEEVHSRILESIGKLFYAVSPSLTSFQNGMNTVGDLCAVYGVDILLRDTLEPLVIGVNPTPSFDSEECFSDVLVTAFGQNGECLDTANITEVTVRETE
ncbi:LOW QUALITY PROTEIN: tubulin--tyrosine ligase-like protein 12 [Acropora millepora]|uniref:LOW QUALITY PROTEIN: tubulin--tyrosine ligase-like protein 12 n=1 Tax=Acropora millepora TaxID=45264 RepID=UPI001CF2898E|nr:LOW QUALITY PROTEIN: tubulin--tyrosine ligase-like protein 12 [Acropora millepora]